MREGGVDDAMRDVMGWDGMGSGRREASEDGWGQDQECGVVWEGERK